MVAVSVHPLRILVSRPGFPVRKILFDVEILQQYEGEHAIAVRRVYGDGAGVSRIFGGFNRTGQGYGLDEDAVFTVIIGFNPSIIMLWMIESWMSDVEAGSIREGGRPPADLGRISKTRVLNERILTNLKN